MSTLQSLLSNIKVEQSGGAPMVPEHADGYVSLTPSGRDLSQPTTAADPHQGVPDNMRLDNGASNIGSLFPGNWADPDNFDGILQSLRDISPLMMGRHIIWLQNQHLNNLAPGICVNYWATELSSVGSTLRVDMRNGSGSYPKPTSNVDTKMVSPAAVGNNALIEPAYQYTKMVAIAMGYVADNCYLDTNGKIQQHNTAGAQGYGFLPVGGVGNYVNHLPNNTQINGLPGAMALASFVPINLNPWMREGSVGQTGGGAFVLSNAPSVAKYCADSNYLVGEVKKQLSLMGAKNMGLSANSENKVKNLLAKLQTAEASLCKTYTLLDAFIGATEQDGTNDVMRNNTKTAELGDLQARKDQLLAEKRKLSVKALSTVLTLQDIVTNAVRAGLGGVPAVPKMARIPPVGTPGGPAPGGFLGTGAI